MGLVFVLEFAEGCLGVFIALGGGLFKELSGLGLVLFNSLPMLIEIAQIVLGLG